MAAVDERFQPKRMRERANGKRAVAQLQEAQFGKSRASPGNFAVHLVHHALASLARIDRMRRRVVARVLVVQMRLGMGVARAMLMHVRLQVAFLVVM